MSSLSTKCPICQADLLKGVCLQRISLWIGDVPRAHYMCYGFSNSLIDKSSAEVAHLMLGKGFAIYWVEFTKEIQMKFISSLQDFVHTDNMIKYNNVSLEDAIKLYQRLDKLKAFI